MADQKRQLKSDASSDGDMERETALAARLFSIHWQPTEQMQNSWLAEKCLRAAVAFYKVDWSEIEARDAREAAAKATAEREAAEKLAAEKKRTAAITSGN